MRALVQRVRHAAVDVDGRRVAQIERGFLVLLGAAQEDGTREADWLAQKVSGLRLFSDEAGRMNLGLADVGGAALVVPQFTLYGDARHGRRPDFTRAAPPERAEPLYLRFCERLAEAGVRVERGVFRAHMMVESVNEGPVTVLIENPESGV